MDLGLAGRTYLVGGGSRGLGRAVAEALVAEGALVVLVARDRASLEEAAAALGERASACVADLAAPGAVEDVLHALDRAGGAVDGALLNHGGPKPGGALELTDEDWRSAFELVLGGPIRLVRALRDRLTDGSSLLFVTSSTVRAPIPGLDTSNVLRPGVSGLVKVLAQALAPRVRVNGLAPGRYETERGIAVAEARASARGVTLDEELEAIARAIPLGRQGTPDEFARVAAFLLSPAASYVTGVNLLADGGMISALP